MEFKSGPIKLQVGAKPRDPQADRARLHAPRFHGHYYDIEGVLPFPRSPQGHPVLVQAGQSAAGVALAARYAEAVFSGPPSLEAAIAFRADLHSQAAALGRLDRFLSHGVTVVGLTDLASRMGRGVPQANGEIAVEPLMDVSVVGQSVLYMANLPLDANVLFHTVMATKMPFVGRG